MTSKFETALLDAGSAMRRSYSVIGENAGKVIALLTAVLAILLTFTHIELPTVIGRGLGADMAVMLIASYVIYFSLEDAGERLGRTTDSYRAAEESYKKRVAAIGGDDLGALRDFAKRYAVAELEYRRDTMLLSLGIDREAYDGGGKGITDRRTLRAIRRVSRMKPVTVTPRLLLGGGGRPGEVEVRDPERHKIARLVLGLLPSTLCMLFTVSMIITAREGLDAGAVISGIVKLSTLPAIAMRGYSHGYDYARLTLSSWLATKERILDAFLLEIGKPV